MDWSKIKAIFEPEEEKKEYDWESLKPKFETETSKNDWESLKVKFEPEEDVTTPAPVTTPMQPPTGTGGQAKGEVTLPKPDLIEENKKRLITKFTGKPEVPSGFGISDVSGIAKPAIDVFGGAVKQLPKQIKAAALSVSQGAKGASVANKDWADEYIKSAQKDQEVFVKEMIDKYGDVNVLPGVKLSDIAQMPQSMAFSATSMGAGLAAGVPVGLLPIPGSRIVAWGLGTVASGKAAYEMSAYQIMQTYLDAKNEEKMTSTGQELTLEEENNLKQGFNKLAKQYALWEAVPEALSNLAFAKILTLPLTKMVGKGIAGKIVERLTGLYGEELLTETITEIGQKDVKGKVGLPGGGEVDWTSPIEWVEAFKAVAPQTFLLTTIMGGTGMLVINTNKVVKSLNKEVKDSTIKEKLIKKVENKEILKEVVKKEAPEVKAVEKPTVIEAPIAPVTGKGKVSKIAGSINAKSIEQGLTKGYGHLAEYTPIVIKEQAQRATDLINNNIDEARKIIRGETPLPEGLKGTALVTAMEERIKKTANGELASELAASPLVSGTSAAAQELRLAAERDPASPVKAIQDINKLLEETIKKRYPGKILNKAKSNLISKIKSEIKNANTQYSWQTFIESIRC